MGLIVALIAPLWIWTVWELLFELPEELLRLVEKRRQWQRQREEVRQQLKEEQRRLDEEQRQREGLIHGFLAMLWQKFFEIFLFSCNFSGFPNNHKSLCTTMPWNILPALAVLWGVCWMFYDPMNPLDDPSQSILNGEQTLFLMPFRIKRPPGAADICA
jgi:hypothetical protein